MSIASLAAHATPETQEAIAAAVDDLPAMHQHVFRMHYGYGEEKKGLRETADALRNVWAKWDLSPQAVLCARQAASFYVAGRLGILPNDLRKMFHDSVPWPCEPYARLALRSVRMKR